MQKDKEKLKKSIQVVKKDFSELKMMDRLLTNMLRSRSIKEEPSEMESFKMLDLLMEIFYHVQYLDTFKNSIRGDKECIDYYNIEFINRHLKTILNEYEMITNNLDSIIFKDNDLCK